MLYDHTEETIPNNFVWLAFSLLTLETTFQWNVPIHQRIVPIHQMLHWGISVHPSPLTHPFLMGSWEVFQKVGGGLDIFSIFRGGLLGKSGVTFFRGLQFLHKKINKNLKYWTTKKVYQQKCFSVITKNFNCEILTKNLVTFKRIDEIKDEKF